MNDLYSSQRAMRNMRKAAMQRGVVAILDVGSSKIVCLILRFDGTDKLTEGDGIGSLAGRYSSAGQSSCASGSSQHSACRDGARGTVDQNRCRQCRALRVATCGLSESLERRDVGLGRAQAGTQRTQACVASSQFQLSRALAGPRHRRDAGDQTRYSAQWRATCGLVGGAFRVAAARGYSYAL